jgi:hypothetical protein
MKTVGHPKDWKAADAENSPSYRAVAKYWGEDGAADLMVMQLTKFTRRFGRRSAISEEAIQELSREIVSIHGRLTVTDVRMVLAKATRRLSEVFQIDEAIILELFERGEHEKNEHDAKRGEEAHEKLTREEKEYREPTDKPMRMSVSDLKKMIQKE